MHTSSIEQKCRSHCNAICKHRVAKHDRTTRVTETHSNIEEATPIRFTRNELRKTMENYVRSSKAKQLRRSHSNASCSTRLQKAKELRWQFIPIVSSKTGRGHRNRKKYDFEAFLKQILEG